MQYRNMTTMLTKEYLDARPDVWLDYAPKRIAQLILIICVVFLLTIQKYDKYVGLKRDFRLVLRGAARNMIQIFKGSVCLNGSPPAYYHAVGFGEGVDNWMVYLEGGGWCMSSESCYSKIQTAGLPGCGNSYTFKNQTTFVGIMSQSQTINPDFYNWNIVFVRYCDGSSYSGDVEEIIQVKDTKIHRRGARLFKAVMEDLLAKGMNKAKNAILAGNSAGGLATILHCDGFRAIIPNAARLKCVADAALFVRGEDLPGAADKRERPFATIVAFHGIDKFLPRSCTSKMDPGLCIFPENLLGDIETPIFLVNSAFDSFQILHNLEPVEPGWNNCTNNIDLCTPIQIEAMRDFRTTLLETLPLWPSSSMGFFIDSCYVHDQTNSDTKWNGPTGPTLNNYNIANAIGDWYFDRSCVREIDVFGNCPQNCTVG
ncbi:hypothetical protein RD792_003994 [Penstemon davidsonii]|uniref:Pectin acetylesterase n=1 Tax=Penstemon davidsonii TaxID=160366 RepID=A0ABR0DG76_9LAMI|nr:hypothetical protein RD792_003994 [Penstemon davidsonii]